MRRIFGAIVLIAAASAAGAGPADRPAPLRLGLISLKDALWRGNSERPGAIQGYSAPAQYIRRKLTEQLQSLPSTLAGRKVRKELLLVGEDPPELAVFDVVMLGPEWTLMLPALDDHAKVFGRYVKRGGGLVVFQPNPYGMAYPPGSKPSPAMARRRINGEYCTPKLLPLPATFYNRYVRAEELANAARRHPITAGLFDWQMPFPADQMFDLDARYQVLAKGRTSGSPSLAAAKFGDGRIVLIADNIGGTSWSPGARVVVERSLLWAAGAGEAEVRRIRPRPAAADKHRPAILICGNGTPTVWRRDLAGRAECSWQVAGKVYAAIALRNGNVLISDYGKGIVSERDADGKVVWDTEGIELRGSVHGLQELANGNILIAHTDGRRVIEVNRQRKIVWEWMSDGMPASAQRLGNGNTLVCLWAGNRVVEVTPEGKVVWEKAGLKVPHDAVKLPNGHVLIADFGNRRVLLVDRKGRTVWQRKFRGGPSCARRLSDGRIVVSDFTDGVVVVDLETRDVQRIHAQKNPGKIDVVVPRRR